MTNQTVPLPTAYLKSDEVAALLKISRGTVYRWLADGTITRGIRVGRGTRGGWRIPRDEVDRIANAPIVDNGARERKPADAGG